MRRRASCLIHRLALTTSSVCGKPVSRGQIHATILIYNMHVKLVHIALPIEVVHDDNDCASPIRRRMMACIRLEEASSSPLNEFSETSCGVRFGFPPPSPALLSFYITSA